MFKNATPLKNRVFLNFLASDKNNAEEIVEAGFGCVIPGIVASDYIDAESASKKVAELKLISDVISVGLGNGGDVSNWRKVVDIASISHPGHINQPFEKASYSQGVLQSLNCPQNVNALVAPSGKVGYVKLSCGIEMQTKDFCELAASMGLTSIKFMPLKGNVHLEELIDLCEKAADSGIKMIEPAGGIGPDNAIEIIRRALQTDIPFFMPHIFGSVIDKQTKSTMPEMVHQIAQGVRQL
ncbi:MULTISPECIES: KDGP aldolase [Bacillus]|uniref:KDGP aldolase n=1 Tax=Bacillus TaxID=1386 RepID=UPI0002FE1E02|nr:MULTISPECIES: KDGP aldolase [Bacillus]